MSKTIYKEIAPYFGRCPSDHEYKAFANGIEGKLVLSWQHPIPHPDLESDEAPEGTNYLRIEVITDSKPDYKPYFNEAKGQIADFLENSRYDHDWRDEEIINYVKSIIDTLAKKIDPAL